MGGIGILNQNRKEHMQALNVFMFVDSGFTYVGRKNQDKLVAIYQMREFISIDGQSTEVDPELIGNLNIKDIAPRLLFQLAPDSFLYKTYIEVKDKANLILIPVEGEDDDDDEEEIEEGEEEDEEDE